MASALSAGSRGGGSEGESLGAVPAGASGTSAGTASSTGGGGGALARAGGVSGSGASAAAVGSLLAEGVALPASSGAAEGPRPQLRGAELYGPDGPTPRSQLHPRLDRRS